MSTPKVVEIFIGYKEDVVVCTEADGARYSWTATEREILGGGVIFEGIETEDHNTYRRYDDQWQSYTPGAGSQIVSDEIVAHLNLVEQAAAYFKSSGQVQ